MGFLIKLFPLTNVRIYCVELLSARIIRAEGELAMSYTILTLKIIPVPI